MSVRCLPFVALAACVVGGPVSYSSGVRWTLPMVAPLEDREVAVLATLDGHGPYLFLVDPDSEITVVDQGVAESLGLYWSGYARVLTQEDHTVPRRVYELQSWRSGDLEIRNSVATSVPAGSLSFRGQPVAGILGMVSPIIVIDVDRDRGVVKLAVAGNEAVPPGSTAVDGHVRFNHLIVPVEVADSTRRELALQVSLGVATSALWPDLLDDLPPSGARPALLVDAAGTRRAPDADVAAPLVALSCDLRASWVRFVDLVEPTTRRIRHDGQLGENVLARWHVTMDRNRGRLWVAPRDADLGAHLTDRLARWGGRFARCAASGCVRMSLGRDGLDLARDPDAGAGGFEVVLEPIGAEGKPLVRVGFGDGIDRRRIAAGLYRVVDVAPLVSGDGGVALIDRPLR
jgi:hypothetical protein